MGVNGFKPYHRKSKLFCDHHSTRYKEHKHINDKNKIKSKRTNC